MRKALAGWTRALALVLAGVAAPAAGAACALKVGWEPWRPYIERGGDGQLHGMDVDLLKSVAERVNCTLTFHEFPWKRVMQGVEKGTLDLAAGADRNAEREAFGHFSAPFRVQVIALFLRRDDLARLPLRQIEDLPGMKLLIGTTLGYSYGGDWNRIKDRPDLQKMLDPGPDTTVGMKKLAAGRIDLFVDDLHSGFATAKLLGVADRVAAHPLVIRRSPSYVLFSKAAVRPERVAAFDQALAALRADGGYDRIEARYQPDPAPGGGS